MLAFNAGIHTHRQIVPRIGINVGDVLTRISPVLAASDQAGRWAYRSRSHSSVETTRLPGRTPLAISAVLMLRVSPYGRLKST